MFLVSELYCSEVLVSGRWFLFAGYLGLIRLLVAEFRVETVGSSEPGLSVWIAVRVAGSIGWNIRGLCYRGADWGADFVSTL